jgi:zinc protease
MRFAVCLGLIMLVTVPVSALDVQQRVLPNGLEIYAAENHNSPVFTMRVYVRAGSIYEDEYLGCGISHFCEHLVSGGTTHKRTEADTERILKAIGGAHNAYTTSDHTCYFIATSSAYADSVIDLLSDWVLDCAIAQEEFSRERGVIQREIAMGMDEPGRRIGKLYNGAMFVRHPEHFPTIGYLELFNTLSRDDVVKYYERMYVPANMFVVAVGDFDADETLDKIEAACSGFPYKAPQSVYLPVDPKQLGARYVEDDMDVSLTYMTMGFRTVMVTDDDTYPLHVLASILGDGRSSRLYRSVKEDLDLVHSISASSYNPEYDAADFTVHVTCDYANAEAARKAILDVLAGVRDSYVTAAELDKAKTQIASDYAFQMQDVEGQASAIGINVLRTGNPLYDEYYLERIKAVTRDDIRRVAGKYLRDDALTVAVLKPAGAEAPESRTEEAAAETAPVTRTVLGNGITLLLKEDHNVPLVHFRAYFRGGSALETTEDNGAFNLMARMLRRGTRRRSSDNISAEIDRIGGFLYSGSGEDYFSCSMDVLGDHFEEGLDLLADCIMNSTFPDDEFDKERDNVLSALKERSDDWQDDAEVRMRKILYGDHPYGLDSRGEETSVAGLTRDYVYEVYDSYCTPTNMVLAVFGDVEADRALAAVSKAFGRFKRDGLVVGPVAPWAGLDQDITKVESSDREQAVIFMGYPGMDLGSGDWCAMRVLDAVISGIGYPGGWLHETLRGQQLVYIVHAWNYALRGRGYFAVMAGTAPEHTDSALAIIREKIAKIRDEYVTDDELEMGKRVCNIMEDLYYSQTLSAQASVAAQYEVLGLGYDYRDNLRAKINTVTKQDIREVADKYLTQAATLVIKPRGQVLHSSILREDSLGSD